MEIRYETIRDLELRIEQLENIINQLVLELQQAKVLKQPAKKE